MIFYLSMAAFTWALFSMAADDDAKEQPKPTKKESFVTWAVCVFMGALWPVGLASYIHTIAVKQKWL